MNLNVSKLTTEDENINKLLFRYNNRISCLGIF